ncbi:CFEM domain-containing protein [Neofusicoccum parvum]|nr:CFEM domain-containing protein [Neofusicoccum parvum]
MRVSAFAAILGYSSLALAQTQLLPTCAQKCVGTDFGGCSTVDVKCICANKELLTGLACCVSTGCNAADQETVINFAQNLCKPQGVTDLPTTATCASSASSATSSASSGTASTTASSAASASASATGSAASSASSAASSVASSAASAASSAAASASAATTAGSGAGSCQGNAAGMGFGLVLAGLLGAL